MDIHFFDSVWMCTFMWSLILTMFLDSEWRLEGFREHQHRENMQTPHLRSIAEVQTCTYMLAMRPPGKQVLKNTFQMSLNSSKWSGDLTHYKLKISSH